MLQPTFARCTDTPTRDTADAGSWLASAVVVAPRLLGPQRVCSFVRLARSPFRRLVAWAGLLPHPQASR